MITPEPLRVEDRHGGGLVVAGDLDFTSAPQLATALDGQIASGQHDVILELSGVQFCDSSGLSAFVGAHRVLRAHGRRLVLRNPAPRVHKLLTATRLDQELEIE